jgi:hypothetical protein
MIPAKGREDEQPMNRFAALPVFHFAALRG